MSNDKEIIKKLASVVAKQQKVISKLAQNLQDLPAAQAPTKREADVITGALPAPVKSTVERLEVHNNGTDSEVRVKFHAGKDSDAAFNAIQKTVHNLQASNMLPGISYVVKQVA